MDDELLISELETETEDELAGNVETSTDRAEDNTGVLTGEWPTLVLTKRNRELLIALLDFATDNEITEDDETSTDLTEDNAGVL